MPAPINSAQAASNSATEHQENTEDMRRTPRTCTLDPKPSSPKSGGEKPLNRQHHLKNKKTSHQHRTPKNTEDNTTPRTCTLDPEHRGHALSTNTLDPEHRGHALSTQNPYTPTPNKTSTSRPKNTNKNMAMQPVTAIPN